MLKNNQLYYFTLTIIVMIMGVISRKIDGVPTFIGDGLYACMIYFGMRILFVNSNTKKAAILALLFCFVIELQQLYRADWILAIRNTTLGHYVLGQGFLWSDLCFYTFGIAIAFAIDLRSLNRN
ncbi:ribosomal maturation YjgA family protein [Flavobacterium alvei]|nr:DUF2809 domain-containing protein [Flavobacterium alvei]